MSFGNYMPWMLCSQLFDLASNECAALHILTDFKYDLKALFDFGFEESGVL